MLGRAARARAAAVRHHHRHRRLHRQRRGQPQLLRPQHAHLSRPRRRARLRLQGDRQGQRRRAAAPRAGRAASGSGAHIAMGTNVDCYQRAEGRYRLMREILAALRDFANPFSILTKGTLILRDLDLLRQAAEVTQVGLSISVGFVDETLWRSVEPGTPSPRRRLDAVRAADRRRLRGRRADGADPAGPHRHRRVDRGDGRGDRGGRRGKRHAAAAAPAPGRPGVVCGLAGPHRSPTWCRATGSSTAAGPTCRQAYQREITARVRVRGPPPRAGTRRAGRDAAAARPTDRSGSPIVRAGHTRPRHAESSSSRCCRRLRSRPGRRSRYRCCPCTRRTPRAGHRAKA